MNTSALEYRRQRGLRFKDEQMALLIHVYPDLRTKIFSCQMLQVSATLTVLINGMILSMFRRYTAPGNGTWHKSC